MDYQRYTRRRENIAIDDYDVYDADAAYHARLRSLGYGSDYDEYEDTHRHGVDRLLGFGRSATGFHGVRIGHFATNGVLAVIGIIVILFVATITISNYTANQPHTLNISAQAAASGAVINPGAASNQPQAAVAGNNSAASAADAQPLGPPVIGAGWTITKTYAEHFGPGPYGAIDIAFDPRTSWGAPLIATHSGVVHLYANDPLYGNKVRVVNDHFTTQYGHLQGFKATEGQFVHRGDVIGYMGSTGNSTGPHVDYQVWQDGKNLNPTLFLK